MRTNSDLTALAQELMSECGLLSTFSPEIDQQVANLPPVVCRCRPEDDLRAWPWCSIDNEDSLDLDQLSYGKAEADGTFSIFVAIADVDVLVAKDSAIDKHAQVNTASIYTPSKIFPMLPEQLSTDWTSLAENADRWALVVYLKVDADGEIRASSVKRAVVCNRAKLSYNLVGKWLARLCNFLCGNLDAMLTDILEAFGVANSLCAICKPTLPGRDVSRVLK